MNKQRRNAIAKIQCELEALREELQLWLDEEQEAFDNMPESIQQGERGEMAQQAIDNLDSAVNAIDEAANYCEEAVQ